MGRTIDEYKLIKKDLDGETSCSCVGGLVEPEENDFCSRGELVALEDIVDLDAQARANNEVMRKTIDFVVGERRSDE